ncbi:c-type cytochrome [Chthonobacter albigriseus]|uniref:c-type cytochrome n=1 Tax=Chthonobacter albigriseus TaxID=1683161 RepID=UPI001FCF26E3|nr:c-type cytochrome [Chthonobacter albigriseus]
MMTRILLAAALTMVAAPVRAADGQLLYNNLCRTCHAVQPGDHRLGPSLAGVHGRKAGSAEGFPYSASMKGADITWTDETLDAFLTDPDAVVSGNGMKPFGGIASEEERRSIVEYLKTLPAEG